VAATEHRGVVANLTSTEKSELLARSDAAGLRHLLVHGAAIAVTTTLIIVRVPLWPAAMLLQGVLLNFLFTTLHETVHRTPFKTRWLNDLVGQVCAFVVLLGPRHFRHFHMAHHRYTNEPGRDPELAGPRPATRLQYLMYLSGVPEWWSRLKTLAGNAAASNTDDFVPERSKAAMRREALLSLLGYAALGAASIWTSNAVLVTTWIVPLVLGGPFLRGYLLAEHTGCDHTDSMFANTRTTFTNVVVRRLAWNMPFHVEHHAFPAVPFHQLPAFHEHTRQHLAHTENGYVRFNGGFWAERDGVAARQLGKAD